MKRKSEILVIAGETSGDLHAAPVIRELKTLRLDMNFFGAGGEHMLEENVELLAGVDELAVMGFSDIPRVLPRISKLKKEIIKRVSLGQVPLAILVDYPGFNLNLARSLKKLPDPPKILYYIAPQAWAWRSGRTKVMRRVIDKLAVVFQFEVDFFRRAGVPVTFVGHPLLEEMEADEGRIGTDNLTPSLSHPAVSEAKDSHPILAILPGSRRHVVKTHLPILIKAAELLKTRIPGIQVRIGKASNLDTGFFQDWIHDHEWIELEDNTRSLLMMADAAIVCSGTATLETALSNTPQVVVYKTSFLNYHIIKRLIKIDNIALVNVVAGRKLVKELVQHQMNPTNIADTAFELLNDHSLRSKIKDGYTEVRSRLGEPGAARRVAELATEMLR